MQCKSIIKKFFVWSMIPLVCIFIFTVIVDPYDVTSVNLLNIKYKLVRDGRQQKINQIKKIKNIDNLILGTSRAERLNPKIVNNILNGFTYSFANAGSYVEEGLGLLLYLEKVNKIPKNVILCLDFKDFNDNVPISGSLSKIPEINFLTRTQKNSVDYKAKLLSLDAFRSAFKTYKNHLNKRDPDAFISDNGYLIIRNPVIPGNLNQIKKVSNEYYKFAYDSGKMRLSKQRFEYLQRIINLSKKYNFNLYIMLTPVHKYLYEIIQKDDNLRSTLFDFKKRLYLLTPYYDAMVLNDLTKNNENFNDAVHTSEDAGNILLKQLLTQRYLNE